MSENLFKANSNSLDTDFKFEVTLSSLIEQGCDANFIQIIRDGIARRSVSKDIEKIYSQYNNETFEDHIHIHTNRESIYDMLPEGLFHQPLQRKRTPDKEDIVQEIKLHQQEEFFARRFFRLFEQAIDNTFVRIHQNESRYDYNVRYREFTDLFTQYWPVLKMLEHHQAVAFMYVIPLLSNIRINLKEIEESISFILNVPVSIIKIKLPAKEAENHFEAHIGKVKLGVDLVLGKSFDDGQYDLKITIGPISSERMRQFLETAHDYIVLINLCELFFPDQVNIIFDFKIDPADSEFILSDDIHATYLGISSYL